jgi:hypothetical protein
MRWMTRSHGRSGWPELSPMDQRRGPALLAGAPTRPTTGKTSRTNFGSWGMSWMGSMPRSTRALEISTTSCDSRLA